MRSSTILLSAVVLAVPAPLLAQSTGGDDEPPAVASADSSDWLDNPRLGLLGLLGLAGLLGLMRREPTIHVDARRKQEGDARD